MSLPLYLVDAFARHPFSGNPAAVCILPTPAGADWMQAIASELNLSETAFLSPLDEGFGLRWFSPKTEVDLCGHGTLAAAHILWEEGRLKGGEPACFYTRSGLLTAVQAGDRIHLDFPSEPESKSPPPPELIEALGISPRYVGRNRFDYLVELSSEKEVRHLQPDLSLLARVPTRGVMVTARSDSKEFDFVSRFFAPRFGIPEDPVTGSAHCCLGPFWKGRLNQETFTAFQASPRGGVIHLRVRGDRVELGGEAVTLMKGGLLVSPGQDLR